MHHPPAPEVSNGKGLANAGERDHAKHVEDRDVDRGGPNQIFKTDVARPKITRSTPQFGTSGPQSTKNKSAPGQKPQKKADLPKSTKLDIREPLVTEPEPVLLDVAHDAEPIANQRSRDDDKCHPKQDVDEKRLPTRIAASGHGWGQEEAAADPSHPDPDDGGLNVHVTQKIEGQVVVKFETVEAGPIVICVGHNGPC